MKVIKDNIKRWRDIPCSWIGRINTVKITIVLKAIYRFNVIPIKLPILFFTELEQKNSQFVCKHMTQMVKNLYSAEDLSLILGSGRFLGEENAYPLQYSCLENPLDRGAGGLQSMRLQTVRHD